MMGIANRIVALFRRDRPTAPVVTEWLKTGLAKAKADRKIFNPLLGTYKPWKPSLPYPPLAVVPQPPIKAQWALNAAFTALRPFFWIANQLGYASPAAKIAACLLFIYFIKQIVEGIYYGFKHQYQVSRISVEDFLVVPPESVAKALKFYAAREFPLNVVKSPLLTELVGVPCHVEESSVDTLAESYSDDIRYPAIATARFTVQGPRGTIDVYMKFKCKAVPNYAGRGYNNDGDPYHRAVYDYLIQPYSFAATIYGRTSNLPANQIFQPDFYISSHDMGQKMRIYRQAAFLPEEREAQARDLIQRQLALQEELSKPKKSK